jgi:hypothetical protein
MATVRLKCSASAADHLPGTATVQGDPTAWRDGIDQGRRDRRRQDVSHTVKNII